MLRPGLVALATLLTGTAAAAADIAALAKAFGAREGARAVQLAPEGDRIAFLTPVGTVGTAAVVADIASGATKVVVGNQSAAARIYGCNWKTSARLLCRLYGVRSSSGVDITFTRLLAVNADGTAPKMLGERANSRTVEIVQASGDVIDWLPDDPGHVLMAVPLAEQSTTGTRTARDKNGLSVQKVDVMTGRQSTVEGGKPNVFTYGTDGHGEVRFMGTLPLKTGYTEDTVTYLYRPKGKSDWISIGQVNILDYLAPQYLGFNTTGDALYALKPKDRRLALFKVAATGGAAPDELVYAHPGVDVDGVLRIGKWRRPVAAAYTTVGQEYEFFDPELKKLSNALGGALPGKPSVSIVDESWDGRYKLVFAGSDVDPGRYYRFDTQSREMNELVAQRPQLAKLTLAKVEPVTYATADGTKINAYLTLPPGQPRKGLPTIVMPHGGPEARDVWGFDWLAQYFAQLGYAVLQPNFRGSTGFGADYFADNGFKSWKMAIGDINDGARWLVSQGIADPAKLVAFGWSYGGYAVLQANVVAPDLYKATVAVAPVTDLVALKEDARKYTSFGLESERIGDGPQVIEGSPARNAAAIKAPVLLFHGDKDQNVDINQSLAMDRALAAAGKAHELVIYPGLEHGLEDSAARAQMLQKSAEFFARAVGTGQ